MREAQRLARNLGDERAVAQHLLEESGDQVAEHLVGVEPGGKDRVPLADSGSRHKLAGQDPARGPFPVRPGQAERLVAGEVVGDLRRRGGLDPEIDLRLQRFGEPVYGVLDPQAPPLGPAAREPVGEQANQCEIAHQRSMHAGAQDLDGERPAIGAARMVHLGEVSDCVWCVVERREQRCDGLAELARDRGPRHVRGERGWP